MVIHGILYRRNGFLLFCEYSLPGIGLFRGIDILGCMLYKEVNFGYFLFASLRTNPLLKRGLQKQFSENVFRFLLKDKAYGLLFCKPSFFRYDIFQHYTLDKMFYYY